MNEAMDWAAQAGQLDRSVVALIGEKGIEPTGEAIANVNPADGSPRLRYHASSPAEVDQAVKSARDTRGGGAWWGMPAAARRDRLLKLADSNISSS